MSILNEQIKLSEAMISDIKIDAKELGLGETKLVNFPRLEAQNSGFDVNHQYPDNRQVFDGQNMVTSESGLETINNSKTAGQLG